MELLARQAGSFVMMGREGTRCHHFWRTLQVACSHFAEEVVCPCFYSLASSDRLVGRGLVVVKRMRTPLLEVGLQSAQLVVGQHADSPSSLELAERLFAAVGELGRCDVGT